MFIIGAVTVMTFTGLLTAGYLELKHEKYDAKNVKTQQVVETAWGVIDHYAKLSSDGNLSVEQAQAAAKTAIRHLRYEKAVALPPSAESVPRFFLSFLHRYIALSAMARNSSTEQGCSGS